MGLKVIVTGSTGMVGEGVLHMCLRRPEVDKVLIINRRPLGLTHPKLTEIIHQDFFNITPIADRLTGYDACYFCLGVSSVGMKEPEYYEKTYTLTLHVAGVLVERNPGMVFCYVSGAGTDGTEKGSSMWARVKGKTENDLRKLPFKQAIAFRPAFMRTFEGLKNTMKYYKYFAWIFPIGRALSPGSFLKLEEVGNAMVNVTLNGSPKEVLEGKDILALGQA